MIPYGSIVAYVTPKGRRYIKKLTAGEDWHTNDGVLCAQDVANANYGDIAHTTLGMPVRVQKATLSDILMGIKRRTQIIYPKDIAQICMKLGVGPGCHVVEAGCGSGGLTLALSWFCGPTGKVTSYDSREEFARLARRNLEWAGLGENVELMCRDAAYGFTVSGADALFLDMREPWLCLAHIPQAARPGAVIGFLLPTVNQVEQLLLAMEKGSFGQIEIIEVLIRNWKPLPDRLRPFDRMTAHTGFLVFARLEAHSPEFENWLPAGTRERKQKAAADARNAIDDDQ